MPERASNKMDPMILCTLGPVRPMGLQAPWDREPHGPWAPWHRAGQWATMGPWAPSAPKQERTDSHIAYGQDHIAYMGSMCLGLSPQKMISLATGGRGAIRS